MTATTYHMIFNLLCGKIRPAASSIFSSTSWVKADVSLFTIIPDMQTFLSDDSDAAGPRVTRLSSGEGEQYLNVKMTVMCTNTFFYHLMNIFYHSFSSRQKQKLFCSCN